jgi:hypothetical protein
LSDVGVKPAVDQRAEPVQGRVQCTLRRAPGKAASILSRENVDPLGPELDRVGNRRVVDHPAVDQSVVADLDGRKDARNRSGRCHRIHRRAIGQQELASVGQIEGDEVQRDRGIGKAFKLEMSTQQAAADLDPGPGRRVFRKSPRGARSG